MAERVVRVFFLPKFEDQVNCEIRRVKNVCQDLVREYCKKLKGKETIFSSQRAKKKKEWKSNYGKYKST